MSAESRELARELDGALARRATAAILGWLPANAGPRQSDLSPRGGHRPGHESR
ncbi:MAG TPA: hypothetical protein VIE44_08720 [Methylomirabilota bacterium]|jgi:hypothetical protein